MKRATASLMAIVLAYLVPAALVGSLAGCASSSPQRTPLETAKLSYADTALAYEAAMSSIEALRDDGHVTDAQLIEVIKARNLVRTTAPFVRKSIDLWQSSGTKPSNYDAVIKQVTDAVNLITAILAEVKK